MQPHLKKPNLRKTEPTETQSFDDRARPTIKSDQPPSPFVLWNRHQTVLCVLCGFALLILAIYFGLLSYHSNGLIDIDDEPHQNFQFQVVLNEADWPELTAIPGIGETLAKRIVEHRIKHGHFDRVESLVDVPGIGKKSLERFRPFLICKNASNANRTSLGSTE